jgi:cytochrome bd-type quinol oxidase subunit 2
VPESLRTNAESVSFSLMVLPFVIVGAVVASRRPRNPIGWILIAEGLLWQFLLAAAGYAALAVVVEQGRRPGGVVAVWLLDWGWALPVALLSYFFLLFPDVRLRGRRRAIAWLAALSVALVIARDAFAPGPLGTLPSISNPFGIPTSEDLLSAAGAIGELALGPLALLASIGSFFLRFRAARGIERQQFKWLTFAGALLLVCFAIGDILSALGVPDSVTSNFNVIPLAGLPVAVGFAVLQYRLYDIDRIINRTLVYGVLTTLLGAVYAIGVILLPQLIGADSPLFVAGSTLAATALFRPLRRLVQEAVDRRFNRRRYDAARTVAAFSARLRQHTDLDALADDLLAVADQTLEPTHVSLWLKPSTGTIREEQRQAV